MKRYSEPLQKYAEIRKKRNVVIAVVYFTASKNFHKFVMINIWVHKHSKEKPSITKPELITTKSSPIKLLLTQNPICFRFQYFAVLSDVSCDDWPQDCPQEHILFQGTLSMYC